VVPKEIEDKNQRIDGNNRDYELSACLLSRLTGLGDLSLTQYQSCSEPEMTGSPSGGPRHAKPPASLSPLSRRQSVVQPSSPTA
jgi:hypothetical protein